MMTKLLTAIWQVLILGLLIGAGLPALFALGIRAMAYGVGGDAEISHERGHPIGRLLGLLCFLAVVLAVALGITVIVSSGFGKSVTFDGVLPVLVDK